MPNTDKTILLPQLQRYDQKIKGWADAKFLTKADTPSLPKATATTLGGVKVGSGLNVTDDGTLSAEDDIVFTWDFDTSAFSCNKTFAEVKKIVTTGVRRTATVNGLLENFSITLLAGVANDNGVMFFGTAPGDALGSGMLGSRTNETITYLFQKGLVITYTPDGQIQMTEDLSNLNTNMSFDFKNTTFQYDQYNSFDLKDGGITSAKLANGAVTAAKLASNAVTTAKIADGAITADKLASDVGVGGSIAEATEKTSGVVYAKVNPRIPPKSLGNVYSLQNSGLHIESINNGVINTEHLANYAVTAGKVANGAISAAKLANNAVTTNKIVNGAVTADKIADGAVSSVKIASNAVTADKIANGTITADKLASGAGGGGGGSIFNLGALSKGTLLSIVSFDCGNFIMYLVTFNIEPTSSGSQISYKLHGTDLLISPKSTGTVHIVPPSSRSGFYSYTLTWFQPKSASAKAALATLLPVQDECEQMEAEVAKLEQDWIDNQDETVAVDGNGVPITIATKKTDLEKRKEELEKKKAELEKLREDYFSKLGDWKNEVQE